MQPSTAYAVLVQQSLNAAQADTELLGYLLGCGPRAVEVNHRLQICRACQGYRPIPEEMGQLPEELLAADDVALVYDEVEGLTYYRDFGRLDALFADPSLARDRMYLTQLREYLQDEPVSPLAIHRLVQRHPEGVDPFFRALLHKPGFAGSGTGRNCYGDVRRPTSIASRHPASPRSVTASSNSSAPASR